MNTELILLSYLLFFISGLLTCSIYYQYFLVSPKWMKLGKHLKKNKQEALLGFFLVTHDNGNGTESLGSLGVGINTESLPDDPEIDQIIEEFKKGTHDLALRLKPR